MTVFHFNEDKKKKDAYSSLYTTAKKAYMARATHCLVSFNYPIIV